jgi:hypothetical protein
MMSSFFSGFDYQAIFVFLDSVVCTKEKKKLKCTYLVTGTYLLSGYLQMSHTY